MIWKHYSSDIYSVEEDHFTARCQLFWDIFGNLEWAMLVFKTENKDMLLFTFGKAYSFSTNNRKNSEVRLHQCGYCSLCLPLARIPKANKALWNFNFQSTVTYKLKCTMSRLEKTTVLLVWTLLLSHTNSVQQTILGTEPRNVISFTSDFHNKSPSPVPSSD